MLTTYEVPDGLRAANVCRSITGDERAAIVERAAGYAEPTTIAPGDTVFLASDDSEDREGDVIALDWVLAPWRRNPVILADHCKRDVIGRGAAAWVDTAAGALYIVVHWHDDPEINPLGALIADQHRNGFRSAGSVGFSPGRVTPRHNLPSDHAAFRRLKDGDSQWCAPMLFEKCELFEFSSVSVPANPRALQRSAETEPEAWTRASIETLIREQLRREVAAEVIRALDSNGAMRNAIARAALEVANPIPPPATGKILSILETIRAELTP